MTSDTATMANVPPVDTAHATPLDEVGASLLTAAGRLLADEGPGALTVRRIAAVAGVSTMNVYSRFGNKDGVVEQLFMRGFALLGDGMRSGPTTGDSLADLFACGDAYRRFALEHVTLYSVMFDKAVPDYEPSPHALEMAAATLQLLAHRIQRAVDAGFIRPDDPLHLAAMVWATCHGAVSLELRGASPADIDWAKVYRDVTHAMVAGLAPRAP